MNILYLEDDVVDQIAFKRLVKKFDEINYDVASSVQEALEQLVVKDYDLILSDFYLGRDTIFDLIKSENPTPIIMLSGVEDENQVDKLYELGLKNHFNKPLTSNNLSLILNKSVHYSEAYNYVGDYNSNPTLEFDFSYLNSISNGNENVKFEMIQLFLQVVSSEVEKIGHLFQKRAWKELGFLTHKLKSNLRIMGLFNLLQMADEIEFICKEKEEVNALDKVVPLFTSTLIEAISLAERELQKMGN